MILLRLLILVMLYIHKFIFVRIFPHVFLGLRSVINVICCSIVIVFISLSDLSPFCHLHFWLSPSKSILLLLIMILLIIQGFLFKALCSLWGVCRDLRISHVKFGQLHMLLYVLLHALLHCTIILSPLMTL